jgi:beta-lactamase regulating signal transducer with metallopeptidase domain
MMLETVMSVAEPAFELCEIGLYCSILAGVAAGLLAVVVLAINLIGRRWMTASQMGLLWGLVLLRMLIPVAPESLLSVQNSVFYAEQLLASPESSDEWAVANLPSDPTTWTPTVTLPYDAPATAGPPEQPVEPLLIDRVGEWLPLFWAAGMLFVLANTVIRHWWFCRRVARTEPSQEPRLLDLCGEAVRELGMKRLPRIVLFDGVTQPAVMGLFRPRILLPSNVTDLNDQQLRMVLLHELTHVKRFDTAKNWLLLIIRACQWWNPIFWLASLRYVNLREQACDAAVLGRLSSDDEGGRAGARIYSELLLTLAARVERRRWRVMMSTSLLGFMTGRLQKRAVANRLRAIRRGPCKQGNRQAALVITLMGVVAMAGFTDAVEPQREPVPPNPWVHGVIRADTSSAPAPSGAWKKDRYKITAVIQRIATVGQVTTEEATERCRITLRCFANLADPLAPVATTKSVPTPILNTNEPSRSKEVGSPVKPRTKMLTIVAEGKDWYLDLSAPQSVHDVVQRALWAWAQGGLRQIVIDTRIVKAERDMVDVAGLQWNSLLRASGTSSIGTPVAGRGLEHTADQRPSVSATATVEEQLPVLVSQLAAEEAYRFLEAAQGNVHRNVMWAPKVTLFNGQHATIKSLSKRPFVTALEFDDDGVLKPQIDWVDDGMQLALDPQITADGTATNLLSRLTLSTIMDVKTVTTTLRSKEVTVQLPKVKKRQIDVSASVLHGKTLLIGLPPAYDRAEYTYLMLTPRVLPNGTGWSR